MPTLTKEEIIARERALYDDCVARKVDTIWPLAQDRLKRWNAYLEEYEVDKDILAWAATMSAKYGPTCRFYNNTVGWVLALLITRYGEAEYFWPTEGLTEDDKQRASELLLGQLPQGCQFIPAD